LIPDDDLELEPKAGAWLDKFVTDVWTHAVTGIEEAERLRWTET
jgi:hypothetical protein